MEILQFGEDCKIFWNYEIPSRELLGIFLSLMTMTAKTFRSQKIKRQMMKLCDEIHKREREERGCQAFDNQTGKMISVSVKLCIENKLS